MKINVIPAQAGNRTQRKDWIPAFAGMTNAVFFAIKKIRSK
jgi:hypothetical protein